MLVSRAVAASVLLLGVLELPASGVTADTSDGVRSASRGAAGDVEQGLVAMANAMVDVDPSPAELAAALDAAGASDVHLSQLIAGHTVGDVDADRRQAPKDDSTLTINEEAMQTFDVSPTPDEVRDALVEAGATDVSVSSTYSATPGRSAATKLPADAFRVSSLWADYSGGSGEKHVVFYGFWNFRDDFVGGVDPSDGSAVQLDGFDDDCWSKVSADVIVKDYRGHAHGHGIRRADTRLKSVFAIDDRTEDFVMLTDNGIQAIDMRRDAVGCNTTAAGSYFYEHNLGGGGWGFSLSILFFSISYGDSGGDSLQKAATYSSYS
jgi:hypothetical protein